MASQAPTERDFQGTVLTFAGWNGWEFRYHTHDSRHSEAGFPDLVMMRPPELVVVELKVGKREPTAAQKRWLDAFRACGVEAHCWWPDDWPEIEARLRRTKGGA